MGTTTSDESLVTAIIPTYGRPEFLHDAVGSVLDQTYDDIELVVVDDASPDPVEPLLEDHSFDDIRRVRCVRHDENRGANAARNTGIEAADGAYLAFLDDDDYWHPDKVKRQVAALRSSGPETGACYTGLAFVDETGRSLGTSTQTLQGDITESLLRGASIGTFTRLMVRADVVDDAGLLDERLPSWQDRDWNLRLSRHTRYRAIPEPLAVHRQAAHEQIGDDYEAKRDVSYPLLLEKHRPLAREYGRRCERRFFAVQTHRLASSALDNGFSAEARRYFLQSIRYDPTYRRNYPFALLASGGEFTYRPAKRLKRFVSESFGGL
jgi:glycosyltransferase involved in cell wall biosynthesis